MGLETLEQKFAPREDPAFKAGIEKFVGSAPKITQGITNVLSLPAIAAEQALYAAMQTVLPQAHTQWEAGDYTGSLQSLAALRVPVDAFFEDVMVNAEALDLRLNRLGLLKCLHVAMNRVADLSKLA